MTAKNTNKVPVTSDMVKAYGGEWSLAMREKRNHITPDDNIAAALNASPELTALIAENEQLTLDNKRMREQLRLAASTEDQQNETILHLQTAKRELAEALAETEDELSTYQVIIEDSYRNNSVRRALTKSRKALAKHGGDHE